MKSRLIPLFSILNPMANHLTRKVHKAVLGAVTPHLMMSHPQTNHRLNRVQAVVSQVEKAACPARALKLQTEETNEKLLLLLAG